MQVGVLKKCKQMFLIQITVATYEMGSFSLKIPNIY